MSDFTADKAEQLTKCHFTLFNGGTGGLVKKVEKIDERVCVIEDHHLTEEAMIERAMKKAMADRAKSVEGWVRALGPYFGSLLTFLLGLIVSGVIKF